MAQDQGGQSPFAGWYIGANTGGSWSDSQLHAHASPGSAAIPTPPIVIPPADALLINGGGSNNNKSGWLIGAEGGYNYVTGNWLIGIETEFTSLDLNESQTNVYNSTVNTGIQYTITQRAKTNWMWTLRPRLGYVNDQWLFYGTVGFATADIKVALNYSDNRVPPNTANTDSSSTKTGYAAGLGAAYAITPQWSLKGEWLYADFGSISTSASTPSGFVTLTSNGKVRANLLRIGADYRF
jgi:outer membrane immunogenic protein